MGNSQKSLLNLARAFIANPEILVVQNPFSEMDKVTCASTMSCFRKFVDERGVVMDPKLLPFRRTRTCVVCTARPEIISAANCVFKVFQDSIEELSPTTGTLLRVFL